MAQEFHYFYEDEVFRLTKKGTIELGMVLENAEFVSSDEEDSDEYKVTKGNIRVAWYPRGEEEVLSEKKVGLADRSLMPGDVVRRLIKGKDTQRGYCRNVYVAATVQIVGTKYVIPNVDSSLLLPLEDFSVDIAIALGSWVGMVNMSKARLYLKTEDGSTCDMSEDQANYLVDVSDEKYNKESEFRRYDFYAGQSLMGLSRFIKDANWTHKTKEIETSLSKPTKSVHLAVDKVIVEQLGVRWQCRAFSNEQAQDKEQPKGIIQGDDLKRVKMLNVFEPCSLQLGDRNYYILRQEDSILSKEQWRKCMTNELDLKNNTKLLRNIKKKSIKKQVKETISKTISSDVKPNYSDYTDDTDDESDTASVSSAASTGSQAKYKKRPSLATKMLNKQKLKRTKEKRKEKKPQFEPGEKLVVETLMTTSKADVIWQDGTCEAGIPSTILFPIHHLDDQEFFPGDFVVEQKHSVDPHEYGVVQKVDHAGRTANVKWFHTYTAFSDPRPVFKNEQEVSVYDLRDHPDFRYRPGSVVIRVANFNDSKNSSIGQVLDNFTTGKVSVWWVDGSSSVCYPQDLYKVGEYDSDEGELWDDSASDGSWETESVTSVVADDLESESDNQIKTKSVANIEKARISFSRLEETFTQNPTLQTTAVMKQLLDCYKECRSIDKLMGTTFFNESNFNGLVEMVREKSRASTNQKMAEQFNRLFSVPSDTEAIKSDCAEMNHVTEFNGECNENDSSVSNRNEKLKKLTEKSEVKQKTGDKSEARFRHDPIRHKRMSETDMLREKSDACLKDSKSCSDLKCSAADDARMSHMCANLCVLMKSQLLKAYEEVVCRFGGHFDMSLMDASKENDTTNTENDVNNKDETKEGSTDSSEKETNHEATSESNINGSHAYASSCEEIAEPNPDLSPCGFEVLEAAPDCHKFKLTMFQPTDPQRFYRTVRNEMKLLLTSLPSGICVRGYEDRMDLYSVMIRGPEKTPYEDGLLFFDFQLSADYPRAPPLAHYISYCSDRLNPNLYEDGKVCISLLGTWSGKGTEMWTSVSNLLQVIISIQGLILVNEPYFNEAGYERQKGTQQGRENSRMYNEMVVLKLIQSMTKVIQNPPQIFKDQIFKHFNLRAACLVSRLERWLQLSQSYNDKHPYSPTTPCSYRDATQFDNIVLPEYPLIPASKGFCLTLQKTLNTFVNVLETFGIDLKNIGNLHKNNGNCVTTT